MPPGGQSKSTDRIIRATAGATPTSASTIKITATTGAAGKSSQLTAGVTYLCTCDQDMWTASVLADAATVVAEDCPRWANTYWYHTPTAQELYFAGLAITSDGAIWMTPMSDRVQ
jgi:hypothetical protein